MRFTTQCYKFIDTHAGTHARTQARTRTHTHTHTHIYIYIYISGEQFSFGSRTRKAQMFLSFVYIDGYSS
jgi:hypothetical protein